MKARRRSLALLPLLMLVACMTSSPTLALLGGDSERVGLGTARLGDTRDSVLANASAHYAVEPICETRKIAKPLSRRAFLYEACTYDATGTMLDGATLEAVAVHFVDARLLRVDLVTAPLSRDETARLIDSLQARYGEPDSVETLPPTSDTERQMTLTVWRLGADEVGLKRFIDPVAGTDGHLEIHLQDARAAREAASLAAW